VEGVYQKINLELGKTHDEYEKQIKKISELLGTNNICFWAQIDTTLQI